MTGAHALPAGLRLGDYEIVSPLTQGGMAAVYLGRRAGHADAEYVAIKVVHPRYADDEAFVSMFLDESRLSSRIQHRNVVRVEAIGEANGLYYLVMEYLHGAPLQLFVRRLAEKKRALKHEVIVHIVASIAEGLHAAHDTKDEWGAPLGIVHRDVTPQNILVSYRGGVKLIDFGIAKAAGRVHQTAKGLLKGKLRYMSPEQAAGRGVDRRTDVYALGIVLWEMLTYRKAFSARTDAELIRLVLQPKLPPPSRLNPAVASELDGVSLTALAPNPDERFQTALAFRNALYGAMPAAARVDETEIASLLRDVLADELQNDARTLPPKVVVVQVPRAIGAASVEDALTQVVPSLEPDEDEPDLGRAPTPPQAPTRERVVTSNHQRTAFGIGLTPPAPLARPPMPGPAVAMAPSASPSFAPPAGMVSTRMHPDVASAPRGTPVRVPPSAMPGYVAAPAPPPTVPLAPAASFTPANAILRPVIPPRGSAAPAQPAAKSRTGSRLMYGCAVAVAVVLTIALGGTLGWLALHGATHAMTP
jgi:serine/threonine protein kinase